MSSRCAVLLFQRNRHIRFQGIHRQSPFRPIQMASKIPKLQREIKNAVIIKFYVTWMDDYFPKRERPKKPNNPIARTEHAVKREKRERERESVCTGIAHGDLGSLIGVKPNRPTASATSRTPSFPSRLPTLFRLLYVVLI